MKLYVNIFLPIVSLSLSLLFPLPGFYFICLSGAVLVAFNLNLRSGFRFISAGITFILCWFLLLETAYKRQGMEVVNDLREARAAGIYMKEYIYFPSYTPVFTSYVLTAKNNSVITQEDIEISYVDLWGRKFKYCSACGEFEHYVGNQKVN